VLKARNCLTPASVFDHFVLHVPHEGSLRGRPLARGKIVMFRRRRAARKPGLRVGGLTASHRIDTLSKAASDWQHWLLAMRQFGKNRH
jgi:hypothetical protein